MKHAKKRLAEMREQNTAISETVLQDTPPGVHTVIVSEEDEESSAFNHLTVPKPEESPNHSPFKRSKRHSRRGSAYSIKSSEVDNETMVC